MKFTLFLHEIKRNKISLIVWSYALAFMLGVCVFIYPEMQSQMGEITEMFADMGSFSDAFGLDQLNFGEFMGYFSVECGNTLGIGGAMLAAIVGIGALSKEERDHTAEMLLTLPVSRNRIVTEKLLFATFHVFLVNAIVTVVCLLGALAISAEANYWKMLLIFLVYFIVQIEIMAITFCISAFIRKGGLGIGIGISFGFYFISIFANLSEEVEFVKYITPFAIADTGRIVSEGTVDLIALLIGIAVIAASVFVAYWQYDRKDIS